MTLGQKIKKLRNDKGLTQKNLADQLHVTFQTVSKWESDTNEPDFSTLKELSKILGCSIEYLFSEEEETEKDIPGAETVSSELTKVKIGSCRDCGKDLYDGDLIHNVERKSSGGIKEMVTICDDCFTEHENEINRRAREIEDSLRTDTSKKDGNVLQRFVSRNDKKPLIWAIVIGVVLFVISLISCIVNFSEVGIGVTIAGPLLMGYAVAATIYCIFTVSYISDVFLSVASWSIRFPGIIFTWDLDGFLWLIAMKLLFFVLGIFIGIFTFLLALAISMVLSIFSFIPLLIYNKTHY